MLTEKKLKIDFRLIVQIDLSQAFKFFTFYMDIMALVVGDTNNLG